MQEKTNSREELFAELYRIIKILRSPDGCPWDRQQTALTLRKDLLEEAYECIEAIEQGDDTELQEELGDLMLVLVLIVRIKEQEEVFTLQEVLEGICAKLIRRHPHVFDKPQQKEVAQIIETWDYIKENIEGKKTVDSLLEKLPHSLPPLARANLIQKKVAKVGFEWDAIEPVFAKLAEEVAELKVEVAQNAQEKIEEELGDVLFSVVNLARMLKVDPVLALQRTNRKFIGRFQKMERLLKQRQSSPAEADITLMDRLWEEIKAQEKAGQE